MAEDPTTWAGLKTSARAWLSDIDTTGLSDDQLEEFIAFAERHFQRTVFSPEREAALSLTATARSVALPSDFWGIKAGPYVDASTDVLLQPLSVSALIAKYPDSTTGTPRDYAIDGENMLLGPTPSGSTSIKGTYWQTISALASGNTTNWLLTDHPDLYLAGTLHFAFLYLMDEARAVLWKGKMDELAGEINKSSQRRHTGGPLSSTTSIGQVPNIQA